jgi:hypothetical protein
MRFLSALCVLVTASCTLAGDNGWSELLTKDFSAWRGEPKNWLQAGDVTLDPANPKKLATKEGTGVFVNGAGNAANLVTNNNYQDVEVRLEFMVPTGSNSGIKFMGLYEIQIYDSFGKKELTGSDCGGIYPRAELKPRYRTLDKGVPPRVNACKAPGEWQTLEATFQAPRFDKDGNKTANARLLKVVLNGQVIHQDAELPYPTGHYWNTQKEIASGPLFVQADHGPIAFRSVRVRPLSKTSP